MAKRWQKLIQLKSSKNLDKLKIPIGYRIIANYCEQNGFSQWQFLRKFKHTKIYNFLDNKK
jgi:hypothetical protein